MYDSLQIYDGPNETSSLLGRFCGKNLPRDLKGNSSQLTIQFTSDETINKPGFCLNFFSGKRRELTFGKRLMLMILLIHSPSEIAFFFFTVLSDSNLAPTIALICLQ